MDPGRVDVKRQIDDALALIDAGEPNRALDDLTQLAEARPDDADVWLELSYACRVCGQEALEYAERAHALAPTDTRTHRELAMALVERADGIDAALDAMKRATELDENDPLNWAVLGAMRLAAGDLTGAARAGDRAQAIDAECVEALLVLGDTAALRGDWENAEQQYRTVVALAPELEHAAATLSWLQARAAGDEGVTSGAIDAVTATLSPSATNEVVDENVEVDTSESGVDELSAESNDGDGEERPVTLLSVAADAPGRDAASTTRVSPAHVAAGINAMNQEVLDAVHRHIDAYNRRDLDDLLDGFTEDAVLHTGNEIVVGSADLAEVFAATFDSPDESTLFLRGSVVQNGTAACELSERYIADDEEYDVEFVGVYTVLAGRIVRARLYQDTG